MNMRFFILCLLITTTLREVNGQVSNYLYKFPIRSASSDIVNMLSKEFKFKNKHKLKQIGFDFSDEKNKLYLKTFQETYEKTRLKLTKLDYLANIPTEVETFGIDILASQAYNVCPSSVSSYLPEIIKHDAVKVFGHYYNDLMENNPNISLEIKVLVGIKFGAYKYKYGISEDLSSITDPDYFDRKMKRLDEDFVDFQVYSQEKYKEFTDAVNRYAFTVRDIYSKIPQYTEMQITQEIQIFKKKYEDERGKIQDKVEKELQQLDNSVLVLIKRQENVNRIVNTINSKIENYNNELERLETEIQQRTNEVNFKVLNLKEQYDEYGRKVKFLLGLSNDILNGKITYNELSSKLKDKSIHLLFGASGDDFIENTLNKEFKKLTVEDFENIVSVASHFSGTLQAFGVLKGKDAQRVDKFLVYASSTIKVGTGAGKLYAGDPTGVLDILGGVGGLTGGGNQKSPELQMLEEVMQRLDQINQKLDNIQASIEILDKKIDFMYQEMARSFQLVLSELGDIKYQLGNIQELTRLILYSEYNSCIVIAEANSEYLKDLHSYNSYIKRYNNELSYCLEGIYKFSSTKDEGFFYSELERSVLYQGKVDYQVKGIFQPLLDISTYFYKSDIAKNDFYNSLLFPIKYPLDLHIPLAYTTDIIKPDYLINNSIQKLFNYEMIYQYNEIFLKIFPYFEISWSRDFKPDDLSNYLKRDTIQIDFKTRLQEARFEKLLNITNKALIQQTLLSGAGIINNFLSAYNSTIPKHELAKVDTILDKNKLLAHNFALSLLSNSWNINPFSKDTIDLIKIDGKFNRTSTSLSFANNVITTSDSLILVNYDKIDSLEMKIINDREQNNSTLQCERLKLIEMYLLSINTSEFIQNKDSLISFKPILKFDRKDSSEVWISDIKYELKIREQKKYNKQLMNRYEKLIILVDSLKGVNDKYNFSYRVLSDDSQSNLFTSVKTQLVNEIDTLNTEIKNFDKYGCKYQFELDTNKFVIKIKLFSRQHNVVTKINSPYPYELKDPKLIYSDGVYKLLENKRILTEKLIGLKFNRNIPTICDGPINEEHFKAAYSNDR